MNIGEGKAVPLQAWRGPEGSRKLTYEYSFIHSFIH